MPGQDQIIGGMSSNGFPHNVIRGSQQTVEMNHRVELEGAQGEGEGEDSPPRYENARPGNQMQ
jgi:chromosome segregation ATPase